MNAAVLTVSDGVVAGSSEDASGDLLAVLLEADGYDVTRRTVPDETDAIAAALLELADEARLVLTTGGTGVAPRDVTPEATRSVIDRDAPGIAEAIRADSIAKTPHALLSRGVAGISRPDARRQPAGLPGRLPGRLRGPASGARATRSSCSRASRRRTARRDRHRRRAAHAASPRSSSSSTPSSRCRSPTWGCCSRSTRCRPRRTGSG